MKLEEILMEAVIPTGSVLDWSKDQILAVLASLDAKRHELAYYEKRDLNPPRRGFINNEIKRLTKLLKIPTGIGVIGNPVTLPMDQYIGSPNDFPFNSTQKKYLDCFQAALKRNNMQPLTIMFAGVMEKPPTWYNKNRIEHPLSFVVATQDGKFIWYKYDRGGASGQNTVIINGDKMKSSTFLNASEPKQDELVARMVKAPDDVEELKKGFLTKVNAKALRQKARKFFKAEAPTTLTSLDYVQQAVFLKPDKFMTTNRQVAQTLARLLVNFFRKELPSAFNQRKLDRTNDAIDVCFFDAYGNIVARVVCEKSYSMKGKTTVIIEVSPSKLG